MHPRGIFPQKCLTAEGSEGAGGFARSTEYRRPEGAYPPAQKKPVRTVSGVAVVAAMTSPERCPHGKCLMCPGGVDSEFKSSQSYTGKEPAAMRASQHGFDPYAQVSHRLTQLREIGHPVEKVELIIMGGTFTARPVGYQRWFAGRCMEAMNDFSSAVAKKGDGNKPQKFSSARLKAAQQTNERARVRCVGVTLETRPDFARERNINLMLELGATKVELGVQNINDGVLRTIERGHTVSEVTTANRLLRDSSLKVGFHMMPGLPGSGYDTDLQMFKDIFSMPEFCPDYLKIYPALVVKGTKLHGMWKRGEYAPMETEAAARLVAEVKSSLPPWVRLQRVQRDIPAGLIEAGVKKGNLRQLARERLERGGKRCGCIRCREVGLAALRGNLPDRRKIKKKIIKYEVCGGEEHFISYEDSERGILIGFLRLRFPAAPFRKELKNAALIRELHVYGPLVPLGSRKRGSWQHRGYGEMLLDAAEGIASGGGFKKIATMSGIGAREYYRKFGYRRQGVYMCKRLDKTVARDE